MGGGRGHGEGGTGQAGAFASPREGAKNALLFAGLNYYMVRAGVEAFVPPMQWHVNHAAER